MPHRISIKDKLARTDAVILCGGRGMRLRKITRGLPKPMVEVNGEPFLELLIRYLNNMGLRRFILASGYKGRLIAEYFQKHKLKDLRIAVSPENKPLGTGGALKNAWRLIKSDPFLVFNGDSFCGLKARGLLESHIKNKALVSMAVVRSKGSKDTGSARLSAKGEVTGFFEKAKGGSSGYINCGVYAFSKKAFAGFPSKPSFSLEYDYFPKMCGSGLYACLINGPLMDIGTPERYKKACAMLERR